MLTDVAARLAAMDPARDLEQAERLGIRFVIPGDEEWPRRLDDLVGVEPVQERGGAPLGLWVRGPVGLHELDGVGRGRRFALGHDLRRRPRGRHRRPSWPAAGQTVVSGAAFGIDQAAHRGSLADGRPDRRGACLRRRPGLPDRPQAAARPPGRDRGGRLRAPPGLRARPGCASCRATG